MDRVTQYRRAERIAARVIEGSAFVVSVDQQRMVELNDVGTFIWEALAPAATVDELVEAVAASFEVEPAAARRDVEAFLSELLLRGIVSRDSGAST